MFKRCIVCILIFLQFYNALFQGALHANILASYSVRDEIYLHGSVHGDGGLRLALGTNAATGGAPEIVETFEIPAYEALRYSTSPSLSGGSSSLVDLDASREGEEGEEAGSLGFTTRDGLTRGPEGAYFTLQGLQLFMDNKGTLLISGAQTDCTKPLFLSSEGGIVLNRVSASALKLTAPAVVGRAPA